MDCEFRRVAPVKPAAGWIGGKKALAPRLVEMIDQVPHELYAEPFVGMGGVFLRRTRAPRAEVVNDLAGDVATFFRILQRHYVPFMEMLRFQITSRREFERLAASDPATLTDLERAARFLYLQRTAYGGKVRGRTFGVSPSTPGRFDMRMLGQRLEELHERLAGVVIENLPFAELIARYDHPGALFYLDPPYHGSEDDYGKGMFTAADFRRLGEILGGIAGRFILSVNATPLTREAFAGFAIEEVELTYTIASGAGTRAEELIVTSRDLPRRAVEADLFGG